MRAFLLPFFYNFQIDSLLRNYNSIICNDHNNKINVLPQLAVPSILFHFSRTKANSLVILDVYDTHTAVYVWTIDIKSLQNRLLKVCYVPATSAGLPRVSFFFSFLFLLLQPLTVLMKQTRQAVSAVKQSIYS